MLVDVAKPLPLLDFKTIIEGPLPPIDWLVEPLIASGDRVVLYGEYGSKKSWTLLHLALCLASGKPWFGHFAIPHARTVLYIDEEMHQRTLKRRLRRLAQGLGLEGATLPLHVLSRVGVRFNEDEAGELLRALVSSECNPDVVIVETLRRVLVGSENDAADVGRFWHHVGPILRAEKTLILSHHMKKPNPNGNDHNRNRASGSTDIVAGADTAFAIDRRPSDLIQVECVKSREVEEAEPFVVGLYDEDPDGPADMRYEGLTRDFKPVDCYGESARARKAIGDLLVAGAPSSSGAILAALEAEGIAKRTVERALKEMVKDGSIVRPKHGTYQLRNRDVTLHAV